MTTPEYAGILSRCHTQLADGTARERVRACGLTLADVAESIHVTEGTVSRYLSGQMFPRRTLGLRLAAFLNSLPDIETDRV